MRRLLMWGDIYELQYDRMACVMFMETGKVRNQRPRKPGENLIYDPIYECEWMEIAEQHLPRLQEMYQIATEAFTAYGHNLNSDRTGDVTVIFPDGMRIKDIHTRVDIKTK